MTRVFSALLGVAFMVFASFAWAADLVVVASSAPDIKAGRIVDSAAAMEVPAGASVTLVSQSGKAITLKGPHSDPPGGNAAGGGGSLVASLSKMLKGGEETAGVGAMRSAIGAKGPADPWAIDVARSGRHCVAAEGPVKLWRSKERRADVLSLRNVSDKSKAKADWPAGAATIEWPSGIALNDGAYYVARRKDVLTASRLEIHLVPAGLPSDAHKAAWMAEKGCVRQARLLLSNLN